MKRFALLLLSAVLMLASNLHASSIDDPNGPGPWIPQPELNAWYTNWMVFQNGTWHGKWTPATKSQCVAELKQVEEAAAPFVTVNPNPGGSALKPRLVYHPAYREAKVIREWMWCIPAAN